MESEMDAELRFHIEAYAEDLIRSGVSCEEAMRRARVEFGGIERIKEEGREARGVVLLESLIQDVRYALRTMRRSPGFTAVAVLSLALGIGANTAIFSLINALMLRMLPVQHPEQLVELLSVYPGEPRTNGFSWQIYERFRNENHVFSGLIGADHSHFNVRAEGLEPETVGGEYVVGDFFPVLGLKPLIGRLIGPEDDHFGSAGAAVAVVSWSYWKNRFNLDPGILGRRIFVDDVPLTVVGVTPRAFSGLQVGLKSDIWMPVAVEPMIGRPSRVTSGHMSLGLMGRLRSGVSIKQARAEMSVLNQWRIAEISKTMKDPLWRQAKMDLEPAGAGFSRLRDHFAKPLLVLMAVVGLLLLIACTNVASLLLARGAARHNGSRQGARRGVDDVDVPATEVRACDIQLAGARPAGDTVAGAPQREREIPTNLGAGDQIPELHVSGLIGDVQLVSVGRQGQLLWDAADREGAGRRDGDDAPDRVLGRPEFGGELPRDARAIKELLRKEVPIALCTGRMFSGTRELAATFRLLGPVACIDGSHIFDLPSRLRELRPFELCDDYVFGASQKKRRAFQVNQSATTEFFQAERPSLADDQIDFPTGRQINHVE